MNLEKYDDISWHEEGDYPAGIPQRNAGSHIAYFLAWAFRRGFLSDELNEAFAQELEAIKRGEFASTRLLTAMDSKVTSEDMTLEGGNVAQAIYDTFVDRWQTWCDNHGFATMYHAPPSPEHEAAAGSILDDLYLSQSR